ncbi:IS66-like element accessory protein TnpA [Rhodoplanes sp. SY1]|uniref:IS66-like element accessory protein TnpA n=1 Tax=Rhodoplanes sp. SY1 TaxID=3166646 RepID=UPI0038B59B53
MAVEVLGRVERRRRFSTEQKLAIVAEASERGSTVSDVARRHGLMPSQVFKWKRLAELGVIGIRGASELPSLIAAETAGGRSEANGTTAAIEARCQPTATRGGVIEIDLGQGLLVRVDRDVDAAALARVLDVLERPR